MDYWFIFNAMIKLHNSDVKHKNKPKINNMNGIKKFLDSQNISNIHNINTNIYNFTGNNLKRSFFSMKDRNS